MTRAPDLVPLKPVQHLAEYLDEGHPWAGSLRGNHLGMTGQLYHRGDLPRDVGLAAPFAGI